MTPIRSIMLLIAAVCMACLSSVTVHGQGTTPTPPPSGGTGGGPTASTITQVQAIMQATSSASTPVSGWVKVTKPQGSLNAQITWDLAGLPAGEHGFHIHTYGDLTKADGTGAGGHFNPTDTSHGCPPTPRHIGDMGSITVGADGKSASTGTGLSFPMDLAGIFSIVGRAIVIHRDVDDCTGASGNAGPRLAIGVLGIANTDNPTTSNNAKFGPTSNDDAPTAATCKLESTGDAKANGITISGMVNLVPVDNTRTRVFVTGISGVPTGSHGFHIHEYGDISDPQSGSKVGGHYNPVGSDHGLPVEDTTGTIRHVGDMGNLVSDTSQTSTYDQVLEIPFSNVNNILGRAIVIHADEDKGTQPTGGAGSKLAQCVIGLAAGVAVPVSANARRGVAFVQGTTGNENIKGTIALTENAADKSTTVTVALTGMTSGRSYALHIHSNADIIDRTGSGMAGHYNPTNEAHGCPSAAADGVWQVGDIATITADGNGAVSLTTTLKAAAGQPDRHPTLTDAQSVIGRGIVIHDGPDPCAAGASFGPKVAVGVIGVAAELTNAATGDASTGPVGDTGAAAVRIMSANQLGIQGNAYIFTLPGNYIRVYAKLSGLPGGQARSIGIHQSGEVTLPSTSGPSISSPIRERWNPTSAPVGSRVGDLGFVIADTAGNAIFDKQIPVPKGQSVLGRTLAITDSQTTATSTVVLAVGVIGQSAVKNGGTEAPTDAPFDIEWGNSAVSGRQPAVWTVGLLSLVAVCFALWV